MVGVVRPQFRDDRLYIFSDVPVGPDQVGDGRGSLNLCPDLKAFCGEWLVSPKGLRGANAQCGKSKKISKVEIEIDTKCTDCQKG